MFRILGMTLGLRLDLLEVEIFLINRMRGKLLIGAQHVYLWHENSYCQLCVNVISLVIHCGLNRSLLFRQVKATDWNYLWYDTENSICAKVS